MGGGGELSGGTDDDANRANQAGRRLRTQLRMH